ncbi:DUF6221 family protein [Amycolatopsis speibonae]|uniref:DUF6221 family protein n=1 Tax=Amycolatopsis speibonae TaxID=1450224 RepID=A0ABV7P2B6_9PSEU
MDDLITFLNNQYASDERDSGGPENTNNGVRPRWDQRRLLAEIAAKRHLLHGHRPGHFAVTWDMDDEPEYHLACAVCRTDVGPEIWPCRHVPLLALPYAGQPGYRDEWRVALDYGGVVPSPRRARTDKLAPEAGDLI